MKIGACAHAHVHNQHCNTITVYYTVQSLAEWLATIQLVTPVVQNHTIPLDPIADGSKLPVIMH